jgi:NAD(P)-dependent dehydrogenase (short-subunit alcohol dehydrogenase family)
MNARQAAGLAGKVVVVTGGGRGLGRGIAAAFAAAGARVAIAGRSEGVVQAAQEIGAGVRGFVCDVSDETDVRRMADEVTRELGAADVLVNNAGINPWYTRPEHTELAQWQQIIGVNLTGVFLGCREFGRQMLERGGGSIINISSVAARSGLPRTAAYCAAKGGLEAMTRSLAVDWAGKGVRVNCVGPGYFETDLTAGLRANDKLSSMVLAHTPMQRYGKPEELVGVCLFLASDAASYVTGQSWMVDGGWTAY